MYDVSKLHDLMNKHSSVTIYVMFGLHIIICYSSFIVRRFNYLQFMKCYAQRQNNSGGQVHHKFSQQLQTQVDLVTPNTVRTLS